MIKIVPMAHDAAREPRIRVAFVTDYDFPTGGIEQFVLQLTTRLGGNLVLSCLTWSDRVLLPPGVDLRVVEHGDVRTVWSSLSEADVIVLITSFNVRLLARVTLDFIIETRRPMLAVVQTSGLSDPSASSAATQLGWIRGIVLNSSTVVAVSNDVRMALHELFNSTAPSTTILVIENAARLASSQRPYRLTRRTVGFIGRPMPQKGFPIYERLAEKYSAHGLTFRANTVSMPPPSPSPNVHFNYNCTDNELLEFFSSLDVLLAPYVRADGLPLALQEAISCGVPIIGFDSPGVSDLLRRHAQIVVKPTYEALEAALVAWHRGDLTIPPPTSGSVEDWNTVGRQYSDLILKLAAATGRFGGHV